MIFKNNNIRVVSNFFCQGVLHCGAGGVSNVDYPPCTVAAFPGEVVARCVFRERHPLLNQPLNGPATIFDHEARCRRVIQPGSGNKCVLNVGFDRILSIQHSGDAALCPT